MTEGVMAESQTLMLEIFERLGSIDARLESGGRRHAEFSEELKQIKAQIAPLPLIAETVKEMKPIVDDYEKSRNKMAGIFLAVAGLASGVGFFASEIKALFIGKH